VSVYKHDLVLNVGHLVQRTHVRPECRSVDEQPCRCVLVAEQSLKVAVLNVRLLGNKSAAMLDHAWLDLFTVAESWHNSAVSPSICAATPTGYYVVDRAQELWAIAASLTVDLGGRRSAWNSLPTELKLDHLLPFVISWKHFFSSLPVDTGKQTDDCFVMPFVFQSGASNTNDTVTV